MKVNKFFLLGFLLLVSGLVFSQTDPNELRLACRRIIYAVKPVETIGALDDTTLTRLIRYALGIPVTGQEPLNETDAALFSFLSTAEMARRKSTNDEFSLYLQEEHERLVPLIRGRGDTSIYIKEDSWLDIFRLNLMLSN